MAVMPVTIRLLFHCMLSITMLLRLMNLEGKHNSNRRTIKYLAKARIEGSEKCFVQKTLITDTI